MPTLQRPRSPQPSPVTSDPDRGIAVNSARDPQRPGERDRRPPTDTSPPGASAEETSISQPGPPSAPEDVERPVSPGHGTDVERG